MSHICESHSCYEHEVEHTGMPFENIDYLYRVMQKAVEDIKTCTCCYKSVDRSNLVMNARFEFSCNSCMVDDGTIEIITADHLLTIYETFNRRREDLTECTVCMNELTQDNTWSTPCGHIFCENCILQLEKCAICRKDLINNY